MANPAALPFSEAIDFYKSKIKLPSSGWTDVWQEQHSHAFVVAGATHDSLVEDLYNAVASARDAGGYAVFQKSFPEIVAKHGWAHNGTPGWRSKVIYDTNITQAFNAGREKQMQAVKHLRPYAMYRHTSIEHPRLEHKAWDGLILLLDDPWWDTHTPQNGWGCKCKKYSLSRIEAEREWSKRGLTGPDQAPPIEKETRIVGKKGSNPRTVEVLKGIDPGFAYNPGKAWLEPHSVRPISGYNDVLEERGAMRLAADVPLTLPEPKIVSSTIRLPRNTPPEVAVSDFLYVFKATLEKGVAWEDASKTYISVTKALFEDGNGDFKWLSKPDKASRLENINLLAITLFDPDEIWWAWEKSRDNPDRWLLKRRYLKSFEVEDTGEYGIVAFEWGKDGWIGSTAFTPDRKDPKNRAEYFDRQRRGRLIFKK